MKTQTLLTLNVLNDLRHAGMDAFRAKHKLPALLLFYSFMDVCASLADETSTKRKTNRSRFEQYLQRYALSSWRTFSTLELWAARSSLLHAYSPLGDHTRGSSSARALFYFAWPEKRDEVQAALAKRGYANFLLVDAQAIKGIAVTSFNGMFQRMEAEPAFEDVVNSNAEHLLKDLTQYRLEDELVMLDELRALAKEPAQPE